MDILTYPERLSSQMTTPQRRVIKLNMGLTLTKVPAAVVADAGKSPEVGSAGECDLQRRQSNWVAISYAHKRIAINDLCRPSDVHVDQLEAAAALKQSG